MAASSPSSPSPQPPLLSISSPSTLPLDLTSPVRIVQKQVLHVRGHARGCTVALFMRLALPTSSKSRSFPLFPDEGVKLKSSAVYPVAMAKGGRSTVIPPNASNGLKRAAQALALGMATAATSARHNDDDDERAAATVSSKQVKPRITSANFHITLVCPPSRDGETPDSIAPLPKAHYVAVIQVDVALALSPPRWPFEARIPIPRCLNNKLRFITADDDDSEDDGNSNGFTVEFDPPLVQRPRPRKSETNADASTMDWIDSESSAGNDDAGDECAISGPFPSSELMVARWAYTQAGGGRVRSDGALAAAAGGYPVQATTLQSDAQILRVEHGDEGALGGVRVSVRVHLTLHDFHYAGLDQTAALYLAVEGGGQWLPETLSVRSERARLLHSWSIDGREESLMSRSSSLSTLAQAAESTQATTAAPFTSVGSLMLFDSSLSDDTSNLIDTQPPKGVADVSIHNAVSLNDVTDKRTPTTALITPPPPQPAQRRPSVGSLHSVASEYSQTSLASDHGLLCLLLRTSALRDAANESADLWFSVQGWIQMQAPARVDEDGAVHFACPSVKATHIDTRASLCSVTDEAVVLDKSIGQAMEHAVNISAATTDAEVVSIVKRGQRHDEVGEYTADTIVNTVGPQRSFAAAREQTRSPDDSLSLSSLAPRQSAQDDVMQWMGVVEEASLKVWMSKGTAQGGNTRRRAVNRLRMTWPRAWPGAHTATTNGDVSARSVLLPTLVMTIPRLTESERIDILHASVHGEPLSVVKESKEGVALSATTSEGPTSTSVQLRLPDDLHGVHGDVYVVLIYSVEGGAKDTPHCLFAPIASTLNYLHVELFDEVLKDDDGDVVVTVSYSDEPTTSSLRVTRQIGAATLDVGMLPAMAKVMLEYGVRTKQLVSLATLAGAPVRRQSVVAAATAQSLSPTRPKSQPPLPPAGALDTRLTWVTLVLVAQFLALAVLMLHVTLTVLPATHNAAYKIDQIAKALDIEVDRVAWHGAGRDYHWAKPQADTVGEAGERSLMVKQHTGLATVSAVQPLLRSAAAWLSLVLTWPFRAVSLLLRR